MPKINPAIKQDFEKFFQEAKDSPEYQALASGSDPIRSVSAWIEELSWQAFLRGLQASRQYSDIFEISCHSCTNSITQSSEGAIITFPLAEDEGWTYDYAKEHWTCPDC